MTFVTDTNLLHDSTFQIRIFGGMVFNAITIAGEAQGAQDADTHTRRQALAVAILEQPDQYFRRMLVACAFEGTADATPNDSEVNALLAAVWNQVAGVVTPSI